MPPAGVGAASGSGPITSAGLGGQSASGGAGNSGGTAVTTGGAVTTPSGGSGNVAATTGGSGTTAGSGGSIASSGGTSGGGGVSSGGSSTGGDTSTGGKTCMDVEPPPDPDWPGATCKNWANETAECKADWFATYCDVSCGRCVPQGGSGGATGAGGSTGSAGSKGMAGSGNMAGSTGASGSPGVDCSTQGLPNVTGGNGWASRYWDCCQTHCAQFDGHRCGQDGTSSTGNTTSSCNGGGSFACYDEAPHAVSDCLAYGYIAKSNPNCGGCYRIQFTGQGQYSDTDPGSMAIKGKQMIVKVSNTGGDVGSNQFDLMIPGGGVGQFNACSKQWGTSDLGAQYGGFLTNCKGDYEAKKACVRQQCMKIPSGPAREGCFWFIDWFQIADDPKFTSQQTNCPF
jgi:hypothetical protein